MYPKPKSALEKHARELAEQLQVDYLELRYKNAQVNDFLLKQVHSTFGCEIEASPEAILAKVKKKQRAVIRHSLKNGLSCEFNSDIDSFYHLLSTSYRNLGTPIFTKKYFELLVQYFGKRVDIAIIKDQHQQPSNAVMNFYFNDQVLPYYGGGNVDARASSRE